MILDWFWWFGRPITEFTQSHGYSYDARQYFTPSRYIHSIPASMNMTPGKLSSHRNSRQGATTIATTCATRTISRNTQWIASNRLSRSEIPITWTRTWCPCTRWYLTNENFMRYQKIRILLMLLTQLIYQLITSHLNTSHYVSPHQITLRLTSFPYIITSHIITSHYISSQYIASHHIVSHHIIVSHLIIWNIHRK